MAILISTAHCILAYLSVILFTCHAQQAPEDQINGMGVDIDECGLGLHNCSSVAQCIDLNPGYTCKCPQSFLDGNPSLPGRQCASRLCGFCNGHGDCVPDAVTNEIICKCYRWFSGTHCEQDIRHKRPTCGKNICRSDLNEVCVAGRVCACPAGYARSGPNDPCIDKGPTCGKNICRSDLNEVCVAGRVCTCPAGYGRSGPDDPCIAVQCHPMFIRVVREGSRTLQWQPSLINLDDPDFRKLSELFQEGIGDVCNQTDLQPFYVSNQVIAIQRPLNVNGTWVNGLFFNFEVCTAENNSSSSDRLWTSLFNQIKQDRYQISGTDLFIDPFQYDPFGFCISSGCHKNAWVFENGGRCVCQCPTGWTDAGDISTPGSYCTNNNASLLIEENIQS